MANDDFVFDGDEPDRSPRRPRPQRHEDNSGRPAWTKPGKTSRPRSSRPRKVRVLLRKPALGWRVHWAIVGGLLIVAGLWHLTAWSGADNVMQQAAMAGNGCFWLLFIYLLGRVGEHGSRPT